MKIIQTCLASLALAGGLVACSNSETNSAAENLPAKIEISADVTEITWEDLMPEGEDELLETLYVEFYQEFERNLVKNSTSLSQATPQETDVSTLITEGSAADTMEQIGHLMWSRILTVNASAFRAMLCLSILMPMRNIRSSC